MATRLRAQRLPRTVRVEGGARRARRARLEVRGDRLEVRGERGGNCGFGISDLGRRRQGGESGPFALHRARAAGEVGGSKQEMHCATRTYGFRARRGTFRFVPELSGTFRFVPFCSGWFRTDFLLPGAECLPSSLLPVACCLVPIKFAKLVRRSRFLRSRIRGSKQEMHCATRTYGFRARCGTFRFVPQLSETFRFVPFRSVLFRPVPGDSAPGRVFRAWRRAVTMPGEVRKCCRRR